MKNYESIVHFIDGNDFTPWYDSLQCAEKQTNYNVTVHPQVYRRKCGEGCFPGVFSVVYELKFIMTN